MAMISEIDLKDWIVYPHTKLENVKPGSYFLLDGVKWTYRDIIDYHAVAYDALGNMTLFSMDIQVNPLIKEN